MPDRPACHDMAVVLVAKLPLTGAWSANVGHTCGKTHTNPFMEYTNDCVYEFAFQFSVSEKDIWQKVVYIVYSGRSCSCSSSGIVV